MQFPSWWLKRNLISWLLWPFSLLFGVIIAIRQWGYRCGIFKTYKSTLPIIVIGNISVGGTGKTPLVIALAEQLKQKGFRPAIISRGYKSQATHFPFCVTTDTPVSLAGDEPLMIARHTNCPVMIDPVRVRAVKALEAAGECDVIISDDGLQHYALVRDVEVVVIDGKRQFGNGFLLPAGMLREPISRISTENIIIVNGEEQLNNVNTVFNMHLNPTSVKSLNSNESRNIASFKNQRIHAMAGIGNPARFFDLLREYHIDIIEHAFPDHHNYSEADFTFLHAQNLPIIMTEKDAVKCQHLVYNAWYVVITAELPETFYSLIQMKLGKE